MTLGVTMACPAPFQSSPAPRRGCCSANLIVERNADDPNRLDVLLPPDLVNQLRVFAVLAQFRLQY